MGPGPTLVPCGNVGFTHRSSFLPPLTAPKPLSHLTEMPAALDKLLINKTVAPLALIALN